MEDWSMPGQVVPVADGRVVLEADVTVELVWPTLDEDMVAELDVEDAPELEESAAEVELRLLELETETEAEAEAEVISFAPQTLALLLEAPTLLFK